MPQHKPRTLKWPRALVCNVHSKTDHLEHWWGCKRDVVSLAFRAGGIYHYAMR